MPQDLSNLQYIFIMVAALTHSGAQVNMSQSDSITNQTVNLSFLTVLSSNKLKSPQYYSICRIFRLLATCWYLSCVCALSSSLDIAQYLSNSTILLHINQPAYFMERNMEFISHLTLIATTGDNARASFLVHQVPRASATVWQYRQMFTQFSLLVWASEYTCWSIIANLLS